ncbi:ATPase, T2SS/T4P/T4SS family [Glaciecola sp. 2405UD65-10]|uniref:GspE/PulE family protein n=1 Tax=Glaciecola sp. 2405UD65-10 TaxID=3397244 RepID=UPI003B58CF73
MFNQQLRENLISTLQKIVQQYANLAQAYEHIEPFILDSFNVQRVSLFQRRSHHRDLVARYKTGSELREFRVPVNTQSIAGYVAMAQHSILVNNPYDEDALRAIHYKLKFEKRYDRLTRVKTDNILAVPIKYNDVLLGVFEVINKEHGAFNDDDMALAEQVASILAHAYKYELGGTARPFDYLVHKGLVDKKVLSNVSKNASIKHLAFILNSEHQIAEKSISEALSIYYQVPAIEFLPAEFHVSPHDSKLNPSYLKRNLVVIVRDANEQAIVLMFEPNNSTLLMEIENALGSDNYQLAFALPSHILQYLGDIKDSPSGARKFDDIIGEISTSVVVKEEKKTESIAENEPAIVRLVTSILEEAVRINASDIHIDPEPDSPTLVRMRVDGLVRDINQVPESHHGAVVSRIKILAGLNIAEKRLPQDGKLIFSHKGQAIDVRVATIPTVVGEGLVMRILVSGDAMSLHKINLAPQNLNRLESMLSVPHGILLVVGPTGSGKTTTLHAALGRLNTPDKKIWTIEDPVEIKQYRLQQVQVNPKIGFTFANALRAFLRADPDVILVGEMRDQETAGAAIEASLTGHLVLSTLHTNSAPETITRLLDLGMDPVNFSDACIGILAQRLVRVLCMNCKEKHAPNEVEMDFIRRQYGEEYFDEVKISDNLHLYKAVGCKECDDTGYKGRTGVHELLTMTPQLRSLVYKKASAEQIKQQSMHDGMRTLAQDAILKVIHGDIDIIQAQIISGYGDQDL